MVNLQSVEALAEHSPMKILLYGQSGAGKSWAASSCPKPAVLLTERNGLQSIRHSNPEAKVAYCSNANDVRDFIVAAMKGELSEAGCESIVVDSLTEIQRLFADEILGSKGEENATMSLQDWGILTDKMRRFMRVMRDIDMNVVCTALVEHQPDEASGSVRVFPAFQGKKLAGEVAQYFNVVGYVFKKEGKDSDGNRAIEHRIMLDGPSRYLCKPCYPLGGIREPDLAVWVGEFNQAAGSAVSKKGE